MKGDSDTLRYVNDHFAHQMMKGLQDVYEEDLECLRDEDSSEDNEVSLSSFGESDVHSVIATKLNLTADQVSKFLVRVEVASEGSKQIFLEKLARALHASEALEKEAGEELNCWKQALVRMGFQIDIANNLMAGQQGVARRSVQELVEKYHHDLVYFSQNKKNSEKIESYLVGCLEELEVDHEELENYVLELGVNRDHAKSLVNSLGLNRLKTEVCLQDFGLTLKSGTLILNLLGYSALQIDELLGFRGFLDSQRQMLA